MSTSSPPMVSISLITYNHEKYARQALDNILNQERDFDIEIIVGDDCSQDNTRSIILEYQEKYPELIQTIFHKEKPQGIPGKVNFVSTIHAANGKYVAMLDGDDYWTDPMKLQKQVDFLESHPDYSMVFHNSRLVFEGVSGHDRPYNSWTTERSFQTKDLVLNEWFIHSGSIMYRREWFPQVKESFYALPSGDIPIGITLSDKGPVGYLPDNMSVYRKNPGSISHGGDHVAIKASQSRIFIFETLHSDLEGRHQEIFEEAIRGHELQIAKFALRGGDIGLMKSQMENLRELNASFSGKKKQLFHILRVFEVLPFLQPIIPMALRLRSRLSSNYQFS